MTFNCQDSKLKLQRQFEQRLKFNQFHPCLQVETVKLTTTHVWLKIDKVLLITKKIHMHSIICLKDSVAIENL